MRITDSGLSSSIGAPSANHERVFGNQVLRTFTDFRSGRLVTAVARLSVDQALQPAGRGEFNTDDASAVSSYYLKVRKLKPALL